MKLAFPRSVLTLGIALAGFLLTPQQASAGVNEIKALATQLNGGALPPGDTNALITFIKSKTSLEIANATIALINTKPKSAALYAGEALKQADETDFGTVLGQRLNAQAGDPGVSTLFATPTAKATFIGTSSKNAATGTTPFDEWIDEFARQLTATNQEAYDAAKKATASKTAVGRIVASRTQDPAINTDALRLDLAQKALIPKSTVTGGQGLTAAAKDVARFVSDAVAPADVDAFTRNLAATQIVVGTKTTQPLLAKVVDIVTGTVTSNPTEGQEITTAMFDGDNLTTPTTVYLATVKNASKLATSLGLVADLEEVSQIAFEFGQRVGDVQIVSGKAKVVGIKQSSVATLAKGLVTGIATRPPGVGVDKGSGPDGAVRYSRSNRLDEIGEVGAYLLAGIKDLPDFQGKDNLGNTLLVGSKAEKAAASRAAALVTSLIKTIITASAKVHRSIATVPPTNPKTLTAKDATFQQSAAEDVAGSVAQTVRSLEGTISTAAFNAIKTALTAATAGVKIAGKTLGPIVQLALASGINGTAYNGQQPFHIFEDGTNPILAQGPFNGSTGPVTEPETDIRSK